MRMPRVLLGICRFDLFLSPCCVAVFEVSICYADRFVEICLRPEMRLSSQSNVLKTRSMSVLLVVGLQALVPQFA